MLRLIMPHLQIIENSFNFTLVNRPNLKSEFDKKLK